MKDFRKIKVWQRSHNFSLEIYKVTQGFPKEEMFGLTSQIRRAAISISANIAEGCGRHTEVDLARFLDMGLGSVNEVDCFLELSKDLNYIGEIQWKKLYGELVEIRKMLVAFIQAVRKHVS